MKIYMAGIARKISLRLAWPISADTTATFKHNFQIIDTDMRTPTRRPHTRDGTALRATGG